MHDNGRPSPVLAPIGAKRRHKADELLAAGVAAGLSLREAAQRANLGERTADRRMADESFRARVMAMRAALVESAVARLSDGAGGAADTLLGLLDPGHAPALRLRAAIAVLELVMALRREVDLEQRISALERGAVPNGRHNRRW